MTGMNAVTGRKISGIEHIQQSVRDILTTPVGSRVMRRDYGSLLPELLAQPLNDATILRVYAAAVMAILRWEPRIKVRSIRREVSTRKPGRAVLSIDAITTNGEPASFEVAAA